MAVLPRPPRAPLPILRPPLRPPGRRRPAGAHREREREDDQGHGVDGARSFLSGERTEIARALGIGIGGVRHPLFVNHGSAPSSIVVTEHRATPPTQPTAPW